MTLRRQIILTTFAFLLAFVVCVLSPAHMVQYLIYPLIASTLILFYVFAATQVVHERIAPVFPFKLIQLKAINLKKRIIFIAQSATTGLIIFTLYVQPKLLL